MMKQLKLVSALAAALLTAPAVFAETYIPWHWDDEAHTVVQLAPQADDQAWSSDIGW